MNFRFSTLLLFVFAWSFSQNLKVMSFNIRLNVDSDKENSWTNRKQDAVDLLSYYHPDYFGVQEALPEQMKDIKNGLKNYDYVGVGRDDGKEKGEFSAIFYDTERLQVIKSGTFWLSETPEKPSRGWDADYNRVCTYAVFKDKKSKKEFLAMNLHFDHVGNVARVKSADLILKKIKEINPKNLPLTLSGDFNLTDDTEPIKIISQNLKDSFYNSEKKHYGPKGTFTAFNVTEVPQDRIDYIFVKGFKIKSNRHINDRRENLLYPSDHFPVLTELQF
ncbi:endonuclease/exonuclease/phosphatase family protein [Chryseobacterium indoltheticum]|uniref:Metal-dependent hydrolase, endonuclease/exonuclease/phosphatase family n=1 Tax=Chryseobacterium indoltheticum TaxID=254 RepID=A0A381F7W3_9FLAO|nr:endonuclease/exonuclease/phosphatase family protein [Chryseobacterium indoltheticum]AZA72978.1 endonuclease/exonuclease/phosphatase family protein [Chryseobacterium indoltheticum]SIP90640.1 Metal-dependent hydrolase, endonuclease/exonuclease/phosphatase family [Chryseobacterium indoltheticum]SUX42587.1 mRNA deadenylase, exonuclease subunit and related nucleases [Chryseobacterium indoltheticum]